MKYALISLALFFSVVCLSQSDTSKYAFNIHFNNGVAFRSLASDNDILLDWNKREKMRFAQGLGIYFSRQLGTHTSVSTGMAYQQMGHQMDSIAGVETVKQAFNFVQIPLVFSYHFSSERRLVPFVSVGMQYGYLVSSRLSYQSETDNRLNSDNNVSDWNRSIISGLGTVGCSMNVYPRNEFSIGFSGQWALNSIATGEMKRNLYCGSLQLGWKYSL